MECHTGGGGLPALRPMSIAPPGSTGCWKEPTLLACPTRWVYLPEDPQTFGAQITFAEGALGGVLVPHEAARTAQVVGVYLGVAAHGTEGCSRFLDLHAERFAQEGALWVWASLRRRRRAEGVAPFLRYLQRHCGAVLRHLKHAEKGRGAAWPPDAVLELLKMCIRLEEGCPVPRLTELLMSDAGLEGTAIGTATESEASSGSDEGSEKRRGRKHKKKRRRSREKRQKEKGSSRKSHKKRKKERQ